MKRHAYVPFPFLVFVTSDSNFSRFEVLPSQAVSREYRCVRVINRIAKAPAAWLLAVLGMIYMDICPEMAVCVYSQVPRSRKIGLALVY